jgi:hypothetical protein
MPVKVDVTCIQCATQMGWDVFPIACRILGSLQDSSSANDGVMTVLRTSLCSLAALPGGADTRHEVVCSL